MCAGISLGKPMPSLAQMRIFYFDPPELCSIWVYKEGYFQKLSEGSESSDMTSEGLEELFKGNSALQTLAPENFRSC
jgi:hypothetical protein